MGWVCVTEACDGHVIDGLWDGTGIAFFSISDEIAIIHDRIFEYLMQVGSTAFMFAFLVLVLTMIIGLIVSVRMYITKHVAR